MSHVYAGKLFAAYPGGPIERDVLTVLALHMKHDDPAKPVTPAIETIAKLAGCTDRRARSAIGTLARGGWIKVLGDRRGGRGVTTPIRVEIGMLDRYPDRSKGRKAEHSAGFLPADNSTNPERGAGYRGGKPGTKRPKTRNEAAQNPERRSAEQGFITRVLNKGARAREADAHADRVPAPAPIANINGNRPFESRNPKPPNTGAEPQPPTGWESDPDAAARFGNSIGIPPRPGEPQSLYVARLMRTRAGRARDAGVRTITEVAAVAVHVGDEIAFGTGTHG